MQGKNGAGDRIRTYDRLITNQLLYRLSYASYAAVVITPGAWAAIVRNSLCRCKLIYQPRK